MNTTFIFALLSCILFSGAFAIVEQYEMMNYYDPPLNPLTGELVLGDPISYGRADVDCVKVEKHICTTYLLRGTTTCFHNDGIIFDCKQYKDDRLKNFDITTANVHLKVRGETDTKGLVAYTIPRTCQDNFLNKQRQAEVVFLPSCDCLFKCGDEKSPICMHPDDCKAWIVEEGVYVEFKEKSTKTNALIFEIFTDDPLIIKKKKEGNSFIDTISFFFFIMFSLAVGFFFGQNSHDWPTDEQKEEIKEK